MKKLVIVALVAFASLSAAAYAYQCQTTCYWIGNVQHCQTICN
jgi:hypothetical protein